MKSEIIIYRSKKKSSYLIIVSLLFATAGLLLLHYTDNNVAAWSLIILAGLCLIYSISSFFDRKPVVILDEYGITELYSIKEQIEWDAIIHVDEFYFRGQYFVRLLLLLNYKPTLIQSTWFYRLDRFYKKEGVKAVYIKMSLLEINSVQLTQFMRLMVDADHDEREELLKIFPKFKQ